MLEHITTESLFSHRTHIHDIKQMIGGGDAGG